MIKVIFMLVSMLAVSASFGEIYKCQKNGKISYQATPCLQKKGGEKVKVQISKLDKRPINIKNCESKCEASEGYCRSMLQDGNYNSDGGLRVCKTRLEACVTHCVDPKDAVRLTEIAENIEREYKNNKATLRANKIREENIARKKATHQEELRIQTKNHNESIALQEKIQKENKKLHEENMALQSRILREQREERKKRK